MDAGIGVDLIQEQQPGTSSAEPAEQAAGGAVGGVPAEHFGGGEQDVGRTGGQRLPGERDVLAIEGEAAAFAAQSFDSCSTVGGRPDEVAAAALNWAREVWAAGAVAR